MDERETVKHTQRGPITVTSLITDLATVGVKPGMTLIVHSSLSSLGWVCGGPVAVVLALEEILGPTGTLVMPTHSGALSDPAGWRRPPVPESWWETIRQTMPAYDPDLTPTRKMGAIPECFRKQAGVRRSAHPQVSFAAWGARAAFVTKEHALDFSLGEHSPLARVYDLDGWVLLLGVGHGNNTSIHLAEYRAHYPTKRVISNGAPVLQNGQRVWATFQDIDVDDDDFVQLGAAFARDTHLEQRGQVGNAPALLVPQKPLIDYAKQWMEQNR